MTGRSPIERGFAGLVLASFLLSFAPPPARGAARDPMDCAAHHTLPSGPAVDATAPGACDAGSMDWCGMMPGCGAPLPALAAVGAFTPVVPLLAAAERHAARTLHGLLALGPPTPPPNS